VDSSVNITSMAEVVTMVIRVNRSLISVNNLTVEVASIMDMISI